MSGSPVIRFRLKPELVALLEERGTSASAVAKKIVLDDLKRSPLQAEHIDAVLNEDLDPEVAADLDELIHAPLPDDLLDEAIDAAGEKSGNSDVETERPNPFLGAGFVHPNHMPVSEADDAVRAALEGDETALRNEWRQLMRDDPGLALEIDTFEEFLRRKREA